MRYDYLTLSDFEGSDMLLKELNRRFEQGWKVVGPLSWGYSVPDPGSSFRDFHYSVNIILLEKRIKK